MLKYASSVCSGAATALIGGCYFELDVGAVVLLRRARGPEEKQKYDDADQYEDDDRHNGRIAAVASICAISHANVLRLFQETISNEPIITPSALDDSNTFVIFLSRLAQASSVEAATKNR